MYSNTEFGTVQLSTINPTTNADIYDYPSLCDVQSSVTIKSPVHTYVLKIYICINDASRNVHSFAVFVTTTGGLLHSRVQ